jgi:hypothetical protein
LRIRDATGKDHVIARNTSIAQFGGRGGFYFIEGDNRTLKRVRSWSSPVETLRTNVVRFDLTADERFAILGLLEAGKPKSVAFSVASRAERELPGQPCCWLDFVELPATPTFRVGRVLSTAASGRRDFVEVRTAGAPPKVRRWAFKYSETAQGGSPGKMHLFNLDTGEDQVTPLVAGLADVSGIIPRPNSDMSLLVDSQGHIALYQPSAESSATAMRLLDLRPQAPRFTGDGKYLIYVEPETFAPAIEGRLMIQDGDFRAMPQVISPPGTSVRPGDFFFIGGAESLVFWARFGRNASDLYFANPETLSTRVVAEGIREVSVTSSRVVGIIRVSQQDLVGDLVQRSTATGEEQVLAYSVSALSVASVDPAIMASRVAFVVRERIGSKQDGLWATTLR